MFKPMLASPCEDLGTIRYPALATPKIDGIRCVMRDGRALSRSLKPIANRFVSATLAGLPPFDGELVVPGTFQDVTSGIMSTDGCPNFRYKVFDLVPPEGTNCLSMM
jgi:DNA ligase-1